MRWYSGGIAEAITVSKSKGAIFVVYIEGKDKLSTKITDLFNQGSLGQRLESEQFVAIKIEGGSVPHQQFSEIFKDPGVPSIYFIGKNGAPLDIITEADDVQSLSNRIDGILHRAGISITSSDAEASGNFIQSQSEQQLPPNNVISENGVGTISSDIAGASKPSKAEEKKSFTPEQIVENTKQVLHKKREEDNEAIAEELRQFREAIDKEKRSNQQAKERVLAQIAQDKAERQSKSSHSKPASPDLNKPQAAPFKRRAYSFSTVLQFKLPNGTSKTHEFGNSDPLERVVSYIQHNLNLSFTDFRLSTTFPRREFTESDFSRSLFDLELTPNAVILVLPVSSGTITTNRGPGTLTNLIWTLFAPFYQIFDYLKSFIFAPKPNVVGSKKPTDASTSKPESSNQRTQDSTVVKKEGNIHRLSDRKDSDDEGNTWNGNSTQQM